MVERHRLPSRGLGGERIPLVGRIVAVADVFDALTHERPYKAAWPVGQAVARIRRGSGSQFDPRVVAAFVSLHEEVVVPAPAGSDGAAQRFIPGGVPRQPAATLTPARGRGVSANGCGGSALERVEFAERARQVGVNGMNCRACVVSKPAFSRGRLFGERRSASTAWPMFVSDSVRS